LPVNRTVYTDTGLEDERMIFIIPRGNKTYLEQQIPHMMGI
jgi:hypothetical protein